MQVLLTEGANVNTKDHAGWTPLVYIIVVVVVFFHKVFHILAVQILQKLYFLFFTYIRMLFILANNFVFRCNF